MTDTRPAVSPPQARGRSWTTLWYYLVVVVSMGFLTAIPFVHASRQLHGQRARWCLVSAVLYTVGAIALLVTAAVFGPGERALYLLVYIVPIAAIVHLTFVRMQISRAIVDPAVDAVLAGRQAREWARRILARDPAMARELRIGRPDLPRAYDDGGLVDLNSAPAPVIAAVCGVSPAVAEGLVAARAEVGVPFLRVDDAFAYGRVPAELWDRIRERAVVVP